MEKDMVRGLLLSPLEALESYWLLPDLCLDRISNFLCHLEYMCLPHGI